MTTLINVTFVLVIALLSARLLRGGRAAVRHALLASGFAALIVLPIASAIAPRVDVPIPIVPRVEPVGLVTSRWLEPSTDAVTPATTSAPIVTGNPAPRVSLGRLLVLAWAAGTIIFLVPVFAGLVEIRRVCRRAVPGGPLERLARDIARHAGVDRRVDVLVTDGVAGPMTWGARRPVIILPADATEWPADDVSRALVHELEHVRRADWLTHGLARAVCAAYWFHPLVWIAWRELGLEAERACDDAVVARADAERYADQLLSLAQRLAVRRLPQLGMANRRDLSRRVLAVLDDAQQRGRAGRLRLAAVIGGAVLVSGALTPLNWVAGVDASTRSAVPLLPIQEPPRQSFEVASVRRNTSPDGGGFIQRRPGGQFAVGNQTLQTLLLFAYQIQESQLVGAPDWINTARFDIVARAPGDVPPTPFGGTLPEALMLRSLLEDRFRLSVHRETRELPIYALVLAHADGRLGPRLRRPTSDYCAKQFEAAAKPGAVPPAQDSPLCGITSDNNDFTAGSFPMSEFARALSGPARRIVVDRTGLTGEWDFDVKWSPPEARNPAPDRPSFFTALQEQLGLRLEATTGPVGVLVIDRVEALVPD